MSPAPFKQIDYTFANQKAIIRVMNTKPLQVLRRAAFAVVLACTPALAQPTTAPDTQPASQAVQLIATITGVKGQVQVRTGPDQPWQTAIVGMQVTEGAEFRTGLRSAVQIQIPPGQTITLDRLGTVQLLEAIRTSAVDIKTDLGMKYGRVRYDIEAAGNNYRASIRSPGSTLAVRGTKTELSNEAPFPPTAVTFTGNVDFTFDGHTENFGSKGIQNAVNSAEGSAARTALVNTFVDPSIGFARGGEEDEAMLAITGLAGFTGGVKVAMGQVRAPNPGTPGISLPTTIPGSLIFQLVWVPTTISNSLTNLDLYVRTPQGLRLKGATISSGEERLTFANAYAPGTYGVEARNVSQASAQYQLLVFKDQSQIKSLSGQLGAGKQVQTSVTVQQPSSSPSTARVRR